MTVAGRRDRRARCRRPRRAGACGGGRRRLAGRRARQAFSAGARRHQQIRHQRIFPVCLRTASCRSRCCAGLPRTRRCRTFSRRPTACREIVLTSRQMRDIFIALEVLLPLSTAAVRRADVVEAALTQAPRGAPRRGVRACLAPLAAGAADCASRRARRQRAMARAAQHGVVLAQQGL